MKKQLVLVSVGLVLAFSGSTAWSANTVYSTDIVNGEVKNADLGTNAVSTVKIQDSAINSAKILDSTVSNLDLAENAVTNNKIQDGTISSGKLAFAVYTRTEVDALIASLQDQITALTSRVAALENSPALAFGSYVSVTTATVNGAPGPNIVINGANLHVLNGTGTTGETVSGLGNLIVGYNELRGSTETEPGRIT